MSINHHYQRVERERVSDIPIHPKDIRHRFVVPIAGLDRAAIQSLAYARSSSSHVMAVHVVIDADEANRVQRAWNEWQKHLPEDEETHLLIIESPYRSLTRPLLDYIDTATPISPQSGTYCNRARIPGCPLVGISAA